MAFCVNCGNDIGANNFCASCGTAAAGRVTSPESPTKGKTLLEVDPDLVCPKCGGVEHYLGSSGGHPEKFCFKCDVAMNFTPQAREKMQRQARRWLGLWGAIVAAFAIWIISLFWPESEDVAAPVPTVVEQVDPEPAGSPKPDSEVWENDISREDCAQVSEMVSYINLSISGDEYTGPASDLDAAATLFERVAGSYTGSDRDWLLKMAELSQVAKSSSGTPVKQLSANLKLTDQFCG